MHTSRFNPYQFDQFAVEGIRAFGAKGIAPNAGHEETDPDWQPV
ncbi:MAG TPA: hypothetical protein VNZ27_01845 [Rhodanobacter sp.]|jgi:hypothetical protein|nr:hypothetical protein [Rhodanobacter sp.]